MQIHSKEDLKNGFDAIIRAEEQKESITDEIASMYSDMKSKGYDVAALKKIVSDHKKGMAKVKELEAMVEVYRDNLGV